MTQAQNRQKNPHFTDGHVDFAAGPGCVQAWREDYVKRGFVVLGPEEIGIDPAIHHTIASKQRQLRATQTPCSSSTVPEILRVLQAPGLCAVCDSLLGPDWAMVPLIHSSPFVSGAHSQHWHKDDNAPYNARKQRHHELVQMELLYYPQAVTKEMGPTMVLPYSHYWCQDYETDPENFSGADHLDFAYLADGMQSRPVSGPNSAYTEADIVSGQTVHDKRLRGSDACFGWSRQKGLPVAPLAAGSVLLFSHNLYHRGSHRKDHWDTWANNPRFMWRFWMYRTTEPHRLAVPVPDWQADEADQWTGVSGKEVDWRLTSIWDRQWAWLHGTEVVTEALHCIDTLQAYLLQRDRDGESKRIGAAYALAAHEDRAAALAVLARHVTSSIEAVRRAATTGLIAIGQQATPVLLALLDAPEKWLRKAGVHALGDSAQINSELISTLRHVLLTDSSIWVRATTAGALGHCARRLLGQNQAESPVSCLADIVGALVESLDQEPNRLSVTRRQNVTVKYSSVDELSDMCEGTGMTWGVERFDEVRSNVRETALWSLVIICSHGHRLDAGSVALLVDRLLAIVRNENNPFVAGFAADALHRLRSRNVLSKAEIAKEVEAEVLSFSALFTGRSVSCLEGLCCTAPVS